MRFLSAVVASAAIALGAGVAHAATIQARDAWIRLPPPGAPTAAGYVTLVNRGSAPDRLTGGRTTAAASLELHQMSMTGGIMRMRPLAGGLAIPAHGQAALSPTGAHLMLVGLRAPLKAGQHVRCVLDFARAGPVAVEFVVRPTG